MPNNHPGASTGAPFLPLPTVEPRVTVETRADGTLILRDPRAAPPPERSIIAYLRRWSLVSPDRLMLAERGADGAWIEVSYGLMRQRADAVAQGLLDLGLKAGDRILILSGNSIEHATLALGAMTIGIAIAPVSPAYALGPSGASKLARVVEAVRPAMVFAQEWRRYAPAVRAMDLAGLPLCAVSEFGPEDGVIAFPDLLSATPSGAVEDAFAATGHETVAKILFSSGSTGWPKGVINTQGMLCVNMAMVDGMWAEAEQDKPDVTLNWMPWNHTMAGNGLFNRSLRQGGAYYIDEGRPLPGEFEKTLRNLKDISPHSHSDVPAGFAMLTAALETDADLVERFFRNLTFVQYAGASLPDELWQRFQRLAVAATGKRIPFLTGYGCTETGPLITQLYWPVEGSGQIGVPVPGLDLKLVPVDATRYEARARGPNLTPGYLGAPEVYAAALDEEGFYRTGDAVSFVAPGDAAQGLRFASRVAEDFKLLTGTFVAVGTLRASLVGALMPLVTDAVIAGHDRAFVGALLWPNVAACRALLGDEAGAMTDGEIVASPGIASALGSALAAFNATRKTSSTRIERVFLMAEPPSAEANEITEKGYVNQRAVLERRAALVAQLYAEPPGNGVIITRNPEAVPHHVDT